jgi:hypothetical protein
VLARIQANGKTSSGPDQRRPRYFQDGKRGQLTLALDDYSMETVVQSVVSATGSLAEAKGHRDQDQHSRSLPIGQRATSGG